MIGGEEGGGDTWQYLALFVYYLYIAFVSSCAWHTAATSGSGSRENEEGRQYFDGKPSLHFTLHYAISVVLGVLIAMNFGLGIDVLVWLGACILCTAAKTMTVMHMLKHNHQPPSFTLSAWCCSWF